AVGSRRRQPQCCRMPPFSPTTTTVPSDRAVTPVAPNPLRVSMMLQLVPSQCSITPTANGKMSLAETAAISPALLLVFGCGFGLETMLQLVPFQCTIVARGKAFRVAPGPTPDAQTLVEESARTDPMLTVDTPGTRV